MSKPVVPVEIRTVLPFNSGRAVFIGNEEKVFVIYVDESVGAAISMFMNDTPKERPLTHDLIGHLMAALGAKVERVIINDLKSETYFARLIISAENELFEKKIVELDGRPSDCIALAIQQKAPIYVSRDVWDEVEDRSDVLRHLEENGRQGEGESRPSTEAAVPGCGIGQTPRASMTPEAHAHLARQCKEMRGLIRCTALPLAPERHGFPRLSR